jgi:predicted transcriptional regulator
MRRANLSSQLPRFAENEDEAESVRSFLSEYKAVVEKRIDQEVEELRSRLHQMVDHTFNQVEQNLPKEKIEQVVQLQIKDLLSRKVTEDDVRKPWPDM